MNVHEAFLIRLVMSLEYSVDVCHLLSVLNFDMECELSFGRFIKKQNVVSRTGTHMLSDMRTAILLASHQLATCLCVSGCNHKCPCIVHMCCSWSTCATAGLCITQASMKHTVHSRLRYHARIFCFLGKAKQPTSINSSGSLATQYAHKPMDNMAALAYCSLILNFRHASCASAICASWCQWCCHMC